MYYQYQCEKCKDMVDFNLKMAERDSKVGETCSKCDGKLIRLITVVGFGDPIKMGLSGKHGGMKEVLQKIHAMAPGSQLDKTSTINKI